MIWSFCVSERQRHVANSKPQYFCCQSRNKVLPFIQAEKKEPEVFVIRTFRDMPKEIAISLVFLSEIIGLKSACVTFGQSEQRAEKSEIYS